MRWVFRLLGLIVLIIIAAIAAVFLLPSDRIAGVVEERFQAATGRALTIEGDVRPSLWPELGVNTGAVSIANADWAGDAPMVAAVGLGELSYKDASGGEDHLFVSGGFAEVRDNVVRVVTDVSEP
ncbi:MAG: AsmA family protein, partial [Pseudomonadota bacterium]